MRSNIQVPVSFGRDETQLLEMLNAGTKRICITRSAWVKQKITVMTNPFAQIKDTVTIEMLLQVAKKNRQNPIKMIENLVIDAYRKLNNK